MEIKRNMTMMAKRVYETVAAAYAVGCYESEDAGNEKGKEIFAPAAPEPDLGESLLCGEHCVVESDGDERDYDRAERDEGDVGIARLGKHEIIEGEAY